MEKMKYYRNVLTQHNKIEVTFTFLKIVSVS